jgi:peroxiredoxin
MKITAKVLSLVLAGGLLVSCGGGEGPQVEDQSNNETTTAVEEKAPEAEKVAMGYQVGDMAEDFELKNVDGEMVSLASMSEAKGQVIVFTCNHCPYSIAYEKRLVELDKKYKALGYPVVAINPNDPELVPEDSFEKMVERSESAGFTFPYLIDEGQDVFPKYGATKTPHVFVVQKTDAGHKVVYTGAIDDSKDEAEVSETYLTDALDALIAGEEPNPSATKAFGCGVKCTDKAKLKKM